MFTFSLSLFTLFVYFPLLLLKGNQNGESWDLYGGTTASLIVRFEDFQMTEGPKMIIPRQGHACGNFQHLNGTNYVIVAGNVWYHNSRPIEILNVDSNDGWIQGKLFIFQSFKAYTC